MPPLSVSNVTIKELFSGSAKFGRPSDNTGAGWVATGDKGIATIQKQVSQDGPIVYVARWTNYMRNDGLNGRILPGLPILRQHDSVYFKTSSTTTLGDRRKAPFCLKFETVEEAEEFEMWWLLKNGSIASWKEEDKKKKGSSNSISKSKINLPLQDTTNTASTPVCKRKARQFVNGPLLKKVKHDDDDYLLKALGGGDLPALSNVCVDDDDDDNDSGISDPCVVSTFESVGLLKEVRVGGKLRVMLKAKRSILKSIPEQLNDKVNDRIKDDDDEKSVHLNEDKGNDSNDDSSSNDNRNDDESLDTSSGKDFIIDDEDAPQSQNWKTAFASY
ncbi:hypothetical protein FRACYDRAFT_247919 [Fragilariopsis cylindrus CCMP1102]|uniref:Uncharacterized protein n=1 Tax=Fragilariopsis cylindrus CCMP1102 TaxID=635003 RepID=A0A1E7EV28_9STRA|nr:hypothetical protein FRACYDRAFT_247919 [Fragilariopsis cylindrus CCMP1102]|eukprot:OEU09664.1 hypothetical protein FRACYDRAFT_247919 [Fragilariopsis cylindrus CCMP1102]